MIRPIKLISLMISAAWLGGCGATSPSPDYLPEVVHFSECEIIHDNGSISYKDSDKCMRARENVAWTYYSFGISAYRKGDYPEAILYYSKAIEVNPDFRFDIFLKRGALLEYLDYEEEAIADYSRAILRKPDEMISYKARGDAYARTGRYEEAAADYEEAIA